MSDQELFECGPLKAQISPRQCLTNRTRAATLKEYHHGVGALWACLHCQAWRGIRVYWPDYEAPDGRPRGMEVK